MPKLPGFSIDPIVSRLPDGVRIYVVGGAVRDLLLGRDSSDQDWVVVGASAADMEAAGFRPVGVDFPVFLHPVTHQEYALARTERKSGHGYKGFTFYADKEVTLEQDLQRRDFTVNAMAMGPDGDLIDPYSGQADLKSKVFRHISPAFAEDPLRVLRLARFLSRFHDFQAAGETLALCRDLVAQGEIKYLVPERVFSELNRAMGEVSPSRAWSFLADLQVWSDLVGLVPAAWKHVADDDQKWLDSTELVAEAKWHWWLAKAKDSQAILSICKALKVPNDLRDGAVVWAAVSAFLEEASQQAVTEVAWVEFLSRVDLYRKPERLLTILNSYSLLSPRSAAFQVLNKMVDQVMSGEFKRLQKEHLDQHSDLSAAQAVSEFRHLWVKRAIS